jgi:hypothetical protein
MKIGLKDAIAKIEHNGLLNIYKSSIFSSGSIVLTLLPLDRVREYIYILLDRVREHV